jgi:hypothetical protein
MTFEQDLLEFRLGHFRREGIPTRLVLPSVVSGEPDTALMSPRGVFDLGAQIQMLKERGRSFFTVLLSLRTAPRGDMYNLDHVQSVTRDLKACGDLFVHSTECLA